MRRLRLGWIKTTGCGAAGSWWSLLTIYERPATEDERDNFLIDLFYHLSKQLVGLHFVFHQRITLPVGSKANTFLHLVKISEMLRPLCID